MVHAGVRNKLALEFTDLGNQLLKNIAEPVQVFSIVFAGADKERNIPDNAMFRRPAVAVLPFENLSGDPEQEFFADGLTEDIITALSLWKSFPVIARNSVFAYKGKSPDIRKVGEELGARYVIEGSVRKSGGRIRVTAQLINSENGHHVWAERYDRELEDIFAVQDEITSTVVGTLEPELARAEFKRVEASPPNSLDAWGLYHRGIAHYGLWNREENLRARKYFEQAIDEDAGFARAYASLSWTYIQAAFLGVSDQDLQMALDSAQRAVALDDKDSFAHLALGRVYHHRKMREEARNELELAISLNPSSAHAHSYIGLVFLYTGHAEQAKHHMELAIRLSPYDPEIGVFLSRLAHVTLQLESYDETIELARKGAQRMDFWPPYAFLTAAYGHLGQTSNAEQARKELERVSPGITIEFVAKHLPADADSLEHLLTGLRVSGLPES
jgi:TolB-like protein/Tfp pilus assembly protein PilF